ncbi:MAG TPA: hypothetical protein VFF73_22175, partial [Planctomycetota bacterium]|nr:hypothetical protein [Planctomycetota bacterium]
TWSPAPGPFEKGMLQSVSSRSPRDDSPSWQGPSHTAGAIGADTSSPGEVSARLDEVKEYHDAHDTPRSADPTKPSATSSPPAADLDHALDVWESWKAERGIAPVDLSPPKPTRPDEKKGP